MKIKTPLHADHQLDQLAAQFEHWRQNRKSPRERIPKPLWDQAVALTAVFPYTRVSTHLRLSAKDLKMHMADELKARDTSGVTPSGFVEVPLLPVQPEVFGTLEVELHRPDGARLRIHSPDASLPLAVIVRSFLEVSS